MAGVVPLVLIFAGWFLLTASLILWMVTDKDGVFSVLLALFPTVGILGVSFAVSASPDIGNDAMMLAIAVGFFLLASGHMLKAMEYRKKARK